MRDSNHSPYENLGKEIKARLTSVPLTSGETNDEAKEEAVDAFASSA
jgi:hypothetical protein